MKTQVVVAALAASCMGVLTGWVLRGHIDAKQCSYLADGYKFFEGEYDRLPEYPEGQISDAVIGNIPTCWANSPFFGPSHPIHLIGAKRLSATRYYLAFEPGGITDINLVFLVDQRNGVIDALQRSTQ